MGVTSLKSGGEVLGYLVEFLILVVNFLLSPRVHEQYGSVYQQVSVQYEQHDDSHYGSS
jgi:hypothetical protein